MRVNKKMWSLCGKAYVFSTYPMTSILEFLLGNDIQYNSPMSCSNSPKNITNHCHTTLLVTIKRVCKRKNMQETKLHIMILNWRLYIKNHLKKCNSLLWFYYSDTISLRQVWKTWYHPNSRETFVYIKRQCD